MIVCVYFSGTGRVTVGLARSTARLGQTEDGGHRSSQGRGFLNRSDFCGSLRRCLWFVTFHVFAHICEIFQDLGQIAYDPHASGHTRSYVNICHPPHPHLFPTVLAAFAFLPTFCCTSGQDKKGKISVLQSNNSLVRKHSKAGLQVSQHT
jgi:hypothetical protein